MHRSIAPRCQRGAQLRRSGMQLRNSVHLRAFEPNFITQYADSIAQETVNSIPQIAGLVQEHINRLSPAMVSQDLADAAQHLDGNISNHLVNEISQIADQVDLTDDFQSEDAGLTSSLAGYAFLVVGGLGFINLVCRLIVYWLKERDRVAAMQGVIEIKTKGFRNVLMLSGNPRIVYYMSTEETRLSTKPKIKVQHLDPKSSQELWNTAAQQQSNIPVVANQRKYETMGQFQEEAFDYIVAFEVLDKVSMSYQKKFFKDASKILKPKGKIVIFQRVKGAEINSGLDWFIGSKGEQVSIDFMQQLEKIKESLNFKSVEYQVTGQGFDPYMTALVTKANVKSQTSNRKKSRKKQQIR